jgi:hypothetical protein
MILQPFLPALLIRRVVFSTDSPRSNQPDPMLMATALYFPVTIGACLEVLKSRRLKIVRERLC